MSFLSLAYPDGDPLNSAGQVATIDGFRHNLVGANNHSMVFDGCVSCQRSGAKSCERCRKSLQLRGKPFSILRPDAVTAVRSTTLSH